MPASNPLDILLAHDHWATRQLLQACAEIPPDQFHQPFDIGPGSLHATLTHIIGAMRFMDDVLAGREPRPRLEQDGIKRTPAQLQTLLDQICDEFAHSARTYPLEGMVSRNREGKTYFFTRGAVLTHVTTHGMHHRAQCLNMLRQLGVKPLPRSSVMEWTRTEESAAG